MFYRYPDVGGFFFVLSKNVEDKLLGKQTVKKKFVTRGEIDVLV